MTHFTTMHPDSSTKRGQGFCDFFGPSPRGDPVNTTPYSGYPRETLALPEVYKGSNPYLTNIMLTLITEEELIPTRILLPMRTTQNETSVTWDEFHFNNTLLGPVPEEGVSRLVTQQVSERRDHYVRYGLAFMIEHGFMNSPKGQMTYRANLEQIRDAVLQSLYIGVIEALLRCKTNSQLFTQCYGKSLTALSARRRLEMEVESFAEIQKSDHGWEMLNSRAQRNLKLHGVSPDAWVVDDGVKKYIASRRESWAYFLHGDAGEKLRLENQGVGDAKSLDIASNTLIFETKQFNLPNQDDPVNITSRKRAIGEYMVSFPHLDYGSCGKYSSSMRDIMAYDEDRDGFTKLCIAEGLQHCQRFDKYGNLEPYDSTDLGPDMFTTSEHPKGVEFFAQMDETGLPDQAVKDWIITVVAQFDEKTKSELMSSLETLHELADKLEARPAADALTSTYFKYIAQSHTKGDSPSFDKTNGFLKLDLFTTEPELAKTDLIPYGFSSYAGICEIAKQSDLKICDDAKKAKKAIDTITQKINSVCYGNMFTQQAAVPSYFKQKCTAAAVYSNIIRKQRLPPLVVKGGVFDLKKFDFPIMYMDNDALRNFKKQVFNAMHLGQFTEGGGGDTSGMDALSQKVTSVIQNVTQSMSVLYRFDLLNILKSVQGSGGGTKLMEELYDVFMTGMDNHDWYSICKAMDKVGDVSYGNPAERFIEALKETAGKLSTTGIVTNGTGKSKTVVTQLTCSDEMKEYCEAIPTEYGADGVPVAPGSSVYNFPTFGAGEVGDDAGVTVSRDKNTGASIGQFRLKRKADDSDEENETASGVSTFEGWWENETDIKKRIDRVRTSYGSQLERIFGIAFLGNAVNGETLKRFIAVGVAFPFNMIYARPFQTYSVSTGICMKAGASTGETLVGHADFQLGDNVIQKLHYGNFTFYSKSVVYRQQQVYLAPNMFSTAYNGGTGSSFFTDKEDYTRYMEGSNHDMRGKSIFAMLAPYSSRPMQNPIDITGMHSGNLAPLNTSGDLHFGSANFYKDWWQWTSTMEDPPARCAFDNDDDGTPNTVCFQGHQSLYNPSSGGMFDIVIQNTGHWGSNVYPGVGKARNGLAKVVETVSYNNLYGGGGNLSGMVK